MKFIFVLLIIIIVVFALFVYGAAPPLDYRTLIQRPNVVKRKDKKRVGFKRMNVERVYSKKDGAIVGPDARVPFYISAEDQSSS